MSSSFELSYKETRDLINGAMETVIVNSKKEVIPAPVSVYVQGPPGCGKSSIVEDLRSDIATRHQIEEDKVVIRVISLTSFDAVDIRGLPAPDVHAKVTTWLKPQIFDFEDDAIGLLMFDELASANPMVQVSIFRIMLEGQLDSFKLPENIYRMAAGNRKIDQSIVFDLPAPLRSRMMIVTMIPDVESTVEYAIRKNWYPSIIGYLLWKPESLFNKNLGRSTDEAFACPRTWEFLSNYVNSGEEVEVEFEGETIKYTPSPNIARFRKATSGSDQKIFSASVTGLIGNSTGLDFLTFMRVEDKLPDMKEVLKPDGKYNLDATDISICYQITGRFGSHIAGLPSSNSFSKNADLQLALANFINKYNDDSFKVVICKMINRFGSLPIANMMSSKNPVVKGSIEKIISQLSSINQTISNDA